uniref:Ribonuclease H-like domain-containing protein n=1 Tax=Tanacetum cinerariifolium TaxID=118510 RepID=A0A6L2LFQ9_TANCI|nr:ribonuclease H-like domain-containing protein [Tanacetum cinerariifolium]
MVVEDTPPPTPPPSITPQICNHFNKGSCKFGDRCKFIHDYRNRPGLNLKNNDTITQGSALGSNSYHQTTPSWAPQGYYNSLLAEVPSQPNAQKRQAHYRLVHQNQAYTHVWLPHVAQQLPPQLYYALPSPQPGPDLHIDTARAISIQSLSRQLPLLLSSQQVHPRGINTSVIRVMKCYAPLFLCFISCNKEKAPHIYHACQLGKHVKLLFHSSDTIVEHCFDIIHLDLWTSPIRSLYGLKQAPRAWFQRFTGYATQDGFYHSRCDSSLFIYRQGYHVAYLLIYVDDIILTASSLVLLQHIIGSLHNEFDMTDLEVLNYFLGIFATLSLTGEKKNEQYLGCLWARKFGSGVYMLRFGVLAETVPRIASWAPFLDNGGSGDREGLVPIGFQGCCWGKTGRERLCRNWARRGNMHSVLNRDRVTGIAV